MKSIDGRLTKLEHRLGITRNAPKCLLFVMSAGTELSPAEEDGCIKSLDDAGRLPASGFGLVVLSDIANRSAVKQDDSAPQIMIELESVSQMKAIFNRFTAAGECSRTS